LSGTIATAPISGSPVAEQEVPVSSEEETRNQVEEDAQEDLELNDEDADDVAGGGGQPHMDPIKGERKL
jgi:hypothetical protein